MATLVYWAGYNMAGASTSFGYMITSIISTHSLVANSWYVMNILAFYIFFYLLMLICKRRQGLMTVGGLAFAFLWTAFCMKMEYGLWWYNASLAIGFGMLWATYEEKIVAGIQKCTTGFFLGSTAAFLICFHYLGSVGSRFPSLYVPMERVISILFILTVLGCSMKFRIGNKVWEFLGEISYELYLIHGLWIYWFTGDFAPITNEKILLILVFACAIVSAVILHKISKVLVSGYQKQLKRYMQRRKNGTV